jgi:hypothetical protein
MTATATISALLRDLPNRDRASLAVELIDSLGDAAWDDDQLAILADERDAEMESGAVVALSYSEFLAGLGRPSKAS